MQTILIALAAALASPPQAPASSSAPAAFQGTWGKNGRCDIAADRLRIDARRAGWGKGPMERIAYSAEDKTLGWDSEYDVANFEVGGWPNTLVYNKEGRGMPDARELYVRCGAGLKRVPVPHQ